MDIDTPTAATTTTTSSSPATVVLHTPELLLAIFSFLPRSPTFAHLPCVNTTWRTVAAQDELWIRHINSAAPHLAPLVAMLQQQQLTHTQQREGEEGHAPAAAAGAAADVGGGNEASFGFASAKDILAAWRSADKKPPSENDEEKEEDEDEEDGTFPREVRTRKRLKGSFLEVRLTVDKTIVASRLLALDDEDEGPLHQFTFGNGCELSKVEPQFRNQVLQPLNRMRDSPEGMAAVLNFIDARRGKVVQLSCCHSFAQAGGTVNPTGLAFLREDNEIFFHLFVNMQVVFDLQVILLLNDGGPRGMTMDFQSAPRVRLDFQTSLSPDFPKYDFLACLEDLFAALEMVANEVLVTY